MDASFPTPSIFLPIKKVAYVCATLCCLLWGSSYPAIKKTAMSFCTSPPMMFPQKNCFFAGYRFLFAGLLLLLFALAQRKPIARLNGRQCGQLVMLGLTQTAIQYAFFYVGPAFTTGVKGSIMNATGTFFSVLLAHFIYQNDRLSYNKNYRLCAGLRRRDVGELQHLIGRFLIFVWQGDGFVVLAAFILSAATLYGKRISQNRRPNGDDRLATGLRRPGAGGGRVFDRRGSYGCTA